ncbi:hypothetical protein [Mesorhizobium sp. M7A.F.Ca.US.008.03.1.1]|uniref:hypothetical protein n=1 Tax=Mesorhizobium sp. M7A.F.Ca.US.008.03.1.1 TaxID=2496742 RepID=UPI000FC9F485|nr:hypothetical protein [Mesorhizobium sp. M7A.F.Ca.US.008.03.1.1]RUW59590.1 hypothetical protein EOA16_22605 [Mesorhizobium sp. M7A.F.Ca.US.008.03.1.1]
MQGDACNQRAALRDDNTRCFYFRLAAAKPGIAVFCPHGGDKGFRLRIGTGSKACAKGGFV